MTSQASRPLISLLIPTRERCETLAYSLQSALAQDSNEFETIVSDNASTDNTPEVVARVSDPRLRYIRTPRRLSMCDNYEFAVENARGEFVVIIGDDDAVMPGAIRKLSDCIREMPADVYGWGAHEYIWPINGAGPRVRVIAARDKRRQIAAGKAAKASMRMGCWRYGASPSVYHSAVARKLLTELRDRTGRTFHSTQPDVFLSFAWPALTNQAIWVGETLTMHGVSRESNGYGFLGDSRQTIEKFLAEYGSYRLHPTLCPDVPMFINMIPDAALVAKDLFPDYYRETHFNYSAMWAFVLMVWKFDSVAGILGKTRNIRRYHEFAPQRFIIYYALMKSAHNANRLWREARVRSFARGVWPANVADCARIVAELTCQRAD